MGMRINTNIDAINADRHLGITSLQLSKAIQKLSSRCAMSESGVTHSAGEWPTRVTQRVQVMIQKRVIFPTLSRTAPVTVPWPVKLLDRYATLRRIPARFVGIGVRPEHVAFGL